MSVDRVAGIALAVGWVIAVFGGLAALVTGLSLLAALSTSSTIMIGAAAVSFGTVLFFTGAGVLLPWGLWAVLEMLLRIQRELIAQRNPPLVARPASSTPSNPVERYLQSGEAKNTP